MAVIGVALVVALVAGPTLVRALGGGSSAAPVTTPASTTAPSSGAPSSPSTGPASSSPAPSPTSTYTPYQVPPGKWKDLPKANPSSEDERVVQVSRLYPLQIPASDVCPTVGTPKNKAAYRDLSRKVIDCQFAAWKPQFEQAGMTLSKPTLIIFNKAVSTACGKASAEQSFYCPATEEIYLSEQRFESSEQWWRLHFANTLVHEFVHHVQHRAGILDASMGLAQGSQERTRRVELQAYCVANRVTLMTPGFRFGQRDYSTLKQWAEQGEESKTHGSRASRQHWWMRGLEQSTVGGCNTWVVPASQVT